MAGNRLLAEAVILSAVSHEAKKEAKKQEKAAEKEQKRKERDPFSAEGKSQEYLLALAIATGNMDGLTPDQIAYVNEERQRMAREEAEKAEQERLAREAKKAQRVKAKAEKPRFSLFGAKNGK